MSQGRPDYEDVESMLFKGFLTLPAVINGVPFIFKTINQHEHQLIDLRVLSKPEEETQEERMAYYIAYSVLFCNQVNVLEGRDEYILHLADSFSCVPVQVCTLILQALNRLNGRARKAIKKIEAYSYGIESKQNWFAYRGKLLGNASITGLSGTGSLGLNSHQKLWIFHNSKEDLQNQYDRDFSIAKFVVSPHANKSIKKLNAKEQAKSKQERKRRQELYFSEGNDTIPEEGEIRVSDESVSDLLSQMKRAVKGQKDFHDKVIEEHERKVIEQHRMEHEKRLRQREEARKRRNMVMEGEASKQRFAVYDESQIADIASKQNQRKTELLSQGSYKDDFYQRKDLLDKWFLKNNKPERTGPEAKETMVPDDSRPESFFQGTILDDYHRSTDEDLTRPDHLDYPDLLDDGPDYDRDE